MITYFNFPYLFFLIILPKSVKKFAIISSLSLKKMSNFTPSPVNTRTPIRTIELTPTYQSSSDDPISHSYSEHVVQFSQPALVYHSSNRSERRYTNASRSDIYEEISLNLNSTPTTPQNPQCTQFTLDEDSWDFKPESSLKHKRVKSQPLIDLTSRCVHPRYERNTMAGKVKFNVGFSDILASLQTNAGTSISKHQSESMDWDISCVSNHQYHVRKISDLDSVLYHDDDSINMKAHHDTVHSKSHMISITSKSHLESSPQHFHSAESTSVPELGPNPCTVYCVVCQKLVHTRVCFDNKGSLPVGLLEVLEKFVGCCHSPIWLNKYKVHQCIECRSVIAKSGMGIRF